MFLRSLGSLYSLNLPSVLVARLSHMDYSGWRLLRWYWHTKTFTYSSEKLSVRDRIVAGSMRLGMAAQIAIGIGFLIEWARYSTAGAPEFGAALLVSYPLVWSHLLAFGAGIVRLAQFMSNPKKLGREIVCTKLEHQVRQLRKQHDFTVVAVAGSVGKTSTKMAIAELLGQNKRVRYQTGNYNDRVTVPLVFFGLDEPNILNIFAWFKIFWANRRVIVSDYPFDVVVLELGTDLPGSMAKFTYIQPDISVVTAISPEHMEFFGTVDAVADEELTVFNYSKRVLVNGDDIAGNYLAGRTFTEYSLVSKQAGYYAKPKSNGLAGQSLAITMPSGNISANVKYVGAQGAKFALAASAVADMLGLEAAVIEKSLPQLSHFAGRMQVFKGINGSMLIDDTYNASPLAVCAALDVLYAVQTSQRIAILGGMNELGDYSQQAHEEVGAYCNPKKLDVVITIGKDAETWLAPAAKQAGCEVISFKTPYEAGDYAKSLLKKDAVVLAKGSQNRVFAEESLKVLMVNKQDASKLVRQSPHWLKLKQSQFGIVSKPS